MGLGSVAFAMAQMPQLGLELPPLPRVPAGAPAYGPLSLFDVAARAEDAGIGALWLAERPDGLDPVPLLGALSVRTSMLGLGLMVRPALGRHPSIVARDVTALDQLSGGRAAVGLVGEGEDPMDVARLGEAAGLVARLLREVEVTAAGRFYEVAGLTLRPRPVRPEGPPVAAGTIGRPVPGVETALAAAGADACLVAGSPAEVALVRRRLDVGASRARRPALVWRGPLVSEDAGAAVLASEILDAGADGLLAVLSGHGDPETELVTVLEVLGRLDDTPGR